MNKITFFQYNLSLFFNLFFFCYLSFTGFLFAQEEYLLKGRVIVPNGNQSGIVVINLVNEKETKTDDSGYFEIDAKEDDLVVFSAEYIEYTRRIIEREDIEKKGFEITILPKSVMIDEVEIFNFDGLDAVSLGILSKPAKKYTKGQRLLRSSRGFTEGIIGIFNPEIKKYRLRVIDVEKEVALLQKLQDMFDDEYYEVYFNLKQDQINSFQYFALGKQEIKTNLQNENKFLVSFFLSKYSVEFLNLQNEK